MIKNIKNLQKEIRNLEREEKTLNIEKFKTKIIDLENEKTLIASNIPDIWDDSHELYKVFSSNKKKAVIKYRRNVDQVYGNIQIFKTIINDREKLNEIEKVIFGLKQVVMEESIDEAMKKMKAIEKIIGKIAGADLIKEKISKARRALKKNDPDMNKVLRLILEGNELYLIEKEWREKAETKLLPQLIIFDDSIKDTIGLRLQERLTREQAKFVASCRSVHRDISLNF